MNGHPDRRTWLAVFLAAGLILGSLSVAVARPGHRARPTTAPAQVAVPYSLVARGVARLGADSPLTLRGRRRPLLRSLLLRNRSEWQAFWRQAGSSPPPPDLARSCVLVVLGRPGSAEAGLARLQRQGRQVIATISSPRWPHLDLAPDSRPFALVRVDRWAVEGAVFVLQEEALSVMLDHEVTCARHLPSLPATSLASLSEADLEQWRSATRRAGRILLARVASLASVEGAQQPYALLLQARVARLWVEDEAQAAALFARVERQWAGTKQARVAASERRGFASHSLEKTAWPWLEARRASLAALPRDHEGRGPQLHLLGDSYEHERTLRPLSMLLAARCHRESALPDGLFRSAEIHDLMFDRGEARRQYQALVQRHPDWNGVLTALDRIAAIEDEALHTAGTVHPHRAFLARFPRSVHALAVRRWIKAHRLP